jgi:hypothetical protein
MFGCAGMSDNTSTMNASEPAISATQGAQRQRKKSRNQCGALIPTIVAAIRERASEIVRRHAGFSQASPDCHLR